MYFQLDVESISWVSSYLCCNIFELQKLLLLDDLTIHCHWNPRGCWLRK